MVAPGNEAATVSVAEPRLLAGRYQVGDLIGRGGMAEVHAGWDTRLGRQVAIKILRSDLARDTSFLLRFRREAQSAAALNHPSIVAVFDSGEQILTESGGAELAVPFIVMERVHGRTLRDVLHDDGPLAPARPPESWPTPCAPWGTATTTGSFTGMSNPPTSWSPEPVTSK